MRHAHILLLGVLTLSGMFQVASATEYELTPLAVNSCRDSWSEITSQNDCLEAGASLLGLAVIASTAFASVTATKLPKGCIYNTAFTPARLRFNTATENDIHGGTKLLCMRASAPPPPRRTRTSASRAALKGRKGGRRLCWCGGSAVGRGLGEKRERATLRVECLFVESLTF